MRKITQIIVHCTATRPAWMDGQPLAAKRAEIRRWHTEERGWRDIGYHWLIDRDGTYIEGRPEAEIGAHVAGRNANSIGVALIGGHGSNENDDAGQHFTAPQLDALRAMLDRLKERYPGATIHGHNEFAAKACPGFNVTAFLAEKRREHPAQSATVKAEAVQMLSGAGAVATAVGYLDGTAQIILIGFAVVAIAIAAFVMRERLRAWAAGWR
jgi:N-acetylmuramoyl-L-alanine amidase